MYNQPLCTGCGTFRFAQGTHEDLLYNRSRLHLAEDDVFQVVIPGVAARRSERAVAALVRKWTGPAADRGRWLVSCEDGASGQLMLDGLLLGPAAQLERESRELGLWSRFRLIAAPDGQHRCAHHPDVADAGRCRVCNRFICRGCRFGLEGARFVKCRRDCWGPF